MKGKSRERSCWLPAWGLLTVALLGACGLPSRVKQLNAMGQQAIAKRQYEQAIAHLSESLAIYPDQPKVALQLDSAKTMLKQVYVFKIYELVDGPVKPVSNYLEAWKMSADLDNLNVTPARVASLRMDLNNHFSRVEPALRKRTEPHNYYLHLTQMNKLVATEPVGRARGEVGQILQRQHLAGQQRADAQHLAGLALLHTAAAATFAPADTGLWVEVTRRREALVHRLGIRVWLQAESVVSAGHSQFLLGGLRRRLPRIFLVQRGAPLILTLRTARPRTDERTLSDRLSGRCQVGTRQEANPECAPLKRSAEAAKRTHEQRLAALQTAKQRCAEVQPQTCASYLRQATSDLQRAQRHYEELEDRVGRCPPYVDKPVYKTFFYKRFTVTRRASASGTVTVIKGGEVWRGRTVSGTASATDTYSEGLSCARIPPDPLNLASLGSLKGQADEQLLDRSLAELLQMRRQLAKQQLAGGSRPEARLDALVRARLVDESYQQVAQQLSRSLARIWASDFGLGQRLVQ
jgi:hypothetical protein